MVEEFEPRHIVGWVEADDAEFPVRVSLWINDLEVAATWADEPCQHNSTRTVRGFRIFLKDIWQFCKRSDLVTVRIAGRPIPIAKKGTYKRPGRGGGQRTLEELRSLLEGGHVFSQMGRLQLSKKLDKEWQESVLGLYRKVSLIVLDKHGYEPFVVYGTLLGLVREGTFIGHDIDFDAAYVSRHRDGPSAAAELRDIAFTLIDAGFDVECRRTALHVHDPEDSSVRIDLFDIYFNDQGELSFPFGIAGTTVITRDEWRGLTSANLAGRQVRVPVDAERLAEHIYGGAWRTPIAGSNWDRARTRRAREGWTPLAYSEEVYWANFYARNELGTGSTFFELVSGRDDLPRTVIDVGCGDGRDTFAFARRGFRVIGIDRSHVGIRQAGEKARTSGLTSSLTFHEMDVADVTALGSAISEARRIANDGPLLYYLAPGAGVG
ncbi:class I SAM-dependent methyltransferase [Luteimonas sp. J16]|uniref:class I SAM-dependent methyltransferase n=3 Tax=unclassified Luteimonas TaxID=2629088 RepID=UPI001644E2FA|nr:class I SAM-dependent methyltransferase [Luteimonas sp. J16]